MILGNQEISGKSQNIMLKPSAQSSFENEFF